MKGGKCHSNIRGSETLTDSNWQQFMFYLKRQFHKPIIGVKSLEWVGLQGPEHKKRVTVQDLPIFS